jgi:hypothetical protein
MSVHPPVDGLPDPDLAKFVIAMENELKVASRALTVKAGFYPWAKDVKGIIDNQIHAIELLIEERKK